MEDDGAVKGTSMMEGLSWQEEASVRQNMLKSARI